MSKQSKTLTANHNHNGGTIRPRYLGVVSDRQRQGETLWQALQRARSANPGYAVAVFSGLAGAV